jgi:Fur family ferric uptake transcriptional regulator
MTELDAALQRLRDAGYKITGARRAVLSVLQESGGHITSSDIVERVKAHDPTVGRASVFRTLELLTSLSIIRPTYVESRAPSYVLLTAEGHHAHIICSNCKLVIELDDCHADQLLHELEDRYHFQMSGHLWEFYGICEACAESSKN